MEDHPITLFGDGMQVRDLLFAKDLVDAFLLAQAHMSSLSGQAYNIGGGPKNTVSPLELLDLIGRLRGKRPVVHFDPWRPGDQRYYVSDAGKFQAATGWSRKVGFPEGVERLYHWLVESRGTVTQASESRKLGISAHTAPNR
jgi:CDP-paratose 2-epimerase